MQIAGFIVLVYGVLTAGGGVMGYVKASSKPSLIAGLVSGALLLACGALILSGLVLGAWGAAAIALALLVIFVVRMARGAGKMPAIPMIVLSLIALATIAMALGGVI